MSSGRASPLGHNSSGRGALGQTVDKNELEMDRLSNRSSSGRPDSAHSRQAWGDDDPSDAFARRMEPMENDNYVGPPSGRTDTAVRQSTGCWGYFKRGLRCKQHHFVTQSLTFFQCLTVHIVNKFRKLR